MGSFPFDKEFLPVVKPDDYIRFLPASKLKDTYRVLQVEPIQPFMIDVLQISEAGVTTLNPNGSTGDRTNSLSPENIKKILATDVNTFAQYRLEPLDDILVALSAPGITEPFGATAVATTYLSKRLPTHKARVQITTAPGTDTLIWANTSANELAGQISGQSPRRKSRIVGLFIYTDTALTVRFGDASVGAGTAASSANALLQFNFTSAPDYISLGRASLPEDLYFSSGIVAQISAAGTVTIVVTVEEDSPGIFGGNLLSRERAVANHQGEIYVWKNIVPGLRVVNPLSIAQTTARIAIAGFLFDITPETPPQGLKPIGIPLYRIPRGGLPP